MTGVTGDIARRKAAKRTADAMKFMAGYGHNQTKELKMTEQSNGNAAGVWGYSGPNPEHIIFCADAGKYNWVKGFMLMMDIPFIEGQGEWEGIVEQCFAVERKVFNLWNDRLQPGIKGQKCVLHLSCLGSGNTRKAHFLYSDGTVPQYVGVWSSFNQIGSAPGWSLFNGTKYYIHKNPPIDAEDEKERQRTAVMQELRRQLWHLERPNDDLLRALAQSYDLLMGKVMPDGTVLSMFNINKDYR